MTAYLKNKKILLAVLSKFDDKEEKTSEILFNVYRKEMEAIVDKMVETEHSHEAQLKDLIEALNNSTIDMQLNIPNRTKIWDKLFKGTIK